MSGGSLECKTEKRQRWEKNPLGPIEEKKKFLIWRFFFLVSWRKKNLGWRKKCQQSGMTGPTLRRRTVSRNGNIRHCHAEGPGFESPRDQYLNDVEPLGETVTSVAVTPRVPGSNPTGTSI